MLSLVRRIHRRPLKARNTMHLPTQEAEQTVFQLCGPQHSLGVPTKVERAVHFQRNPLGNESDVHFEALDLKVVFVEKV